MRWLKLAWQNLGRNRRRTIATLMLVSMAVAGLLTTSGFALYTYESLQEFAMRENGQLMMTHADFFELEEEYPLQFGISESERIRESLLKDLNLSYVLPSIQFNGLITNGEKSTIFIGEGVDVDLPKVMGPALSIKEGTFFSRYQDDNQDFEVILGRGLAKSLNVGLGGGLTLMSSTADGALNAVDVSVKGIVATGIPDLDARYLMVHNATAQFLLDTDKVSQLSIYLRDDTLQKSYQSAFEQEYANLAVTPWQDRAFFYKSVKNLYDRIFGVMGGVILIMVLFAVFNTSAMSVLERIREIGTLAAMGTRSSEIVRLFLYEGILIALLGSVIGFLLAGSVTIGLTVFDINMPPPPGQTDGYPLQVYFSLGVAGLSLLSMVSIAILASAFAVQKGVKLQISEALRYA